MKISPLLSFLALMIIPGMNKAQNIEIIGSLKVSDMSISNTTDSVVVRMSDGTLGIRQASSLNLQQQTYSIGDTAFGGIVFWVDPFGLHGLVAGLMDLYSPGFPGNFIFEESTYTMAERDGIYAGSINSTVNTTPFAYLFSGSLDYQHLVPYKDYLKYYLEGGYGDWYVPSKIELTLVYQNLHLMGIGNFNNGLYGSSTALYTINFSCCPTAPAWNLNFSDGTTDTYADPPPPVRIRPIRAF